MSSSFNEVSGTGRPQSIGCLTSPIIKALSDRCGFAIPSTPFEEVWAALRDRRIHQHVRSYTLKQAKIGYELIAYVDQSVWYQEFSMLAPGILIELNELAREKGSDVRISKITFKISREARSRGVTASVATNGAPDERPIMELTEAERARIVRTMMPIEDKSLRQAANKAMEAWLKWRKTL